MAPTAPQSGGRVRCDLGVGGGRGVSAARVDVVLLHRHRFTDSEAQIFARTPPLVVATASAPSGGAQEGGGRLTVAVGLPADAPPSAVGSQSRFVYEVRATAEVAGGGTAHATAPLTVRSPRRLYRENEGRVQHDRGRTDLDVASWAAQPGGRIAGNVTAHVDSGGRAHGAAAVELLRAESFGRETGPIDPVRHSRYRRASATAVDLGAGGAAFALAVPADAPPTVVGDRSWIRWFVHVQLASGWLPARTWGEVNVFTGDP